MQKKATEEYQVYMTNDTVRGVMLEKARHPGLECIIQMPGVRIGNCFYFDMVADSGINATYEACMCEKDHVYIDHLATRIAEYYEFPVELLTVSQMHYHPPKYEHFSPGDGPANTKLAQQFGGVVCGIFLVDPEFRMKFWYIDECGRETPVDYIVDDEAVAVAMPKKSLEKLKYEIEKNEAGVIVRHRKNEIVRADGRESKCNEGNKGELFSLLSQISAGNLVKGRRIGR